MIAPPPLKIKKEEESPPSLTVKTITSVAESPSINEQILQKPTLPTTESSTSLSSSMAVMPTQHLTQIMHGDDFGGEDIGTNVTICHDTDPDTSLEENMLRIEDSDSSKNPSPMPAVAEQNALQ